MVPSSKRLPFPTAVTSASWGFSLAESGMCKPPCICCFSSIRLTTMRSWSGRIVIIMFLFLLGFRVDQAFETLFRFIADGLAGDARDRLSCEPKTGVVLCAHGAQQASARRLKVFQQQ